MWNYRMYTAKIDIEAGSFVTTEDVMAFPNFFSGNSGDTCSEITEGDYNYMRDSRDRLREQRDKALARSKYDFRIANYEKCSKTFQMYESDPEHGLIAGDRVKAVAKMAKHITAYTWEYTWYYLVHKIGDTVLFLVEGNQLRECKK